MGPRVTQPLHLVPSWSDDEVTAVWHRPPAPAPALAPAVAAPTRRWPRRLAIALTALALLGVAAVFAARAYAEHLVRARLAAIAATLDRPIRAGDIDISTGAAVIDDLEIDGLAAVDRVEVRFTITDLFARRVRVDSIDAHHVTAEIERDELDDLLARLRRRTPRANAPSRVDLSTARLAAHDLTVVARDAARGLSATAEIAELVARDRETLAFSGARLVLEGEHLFARVLAANPVAGAGGTIARRDEGLRLDLAGHLAGHPDQRWRVGAAITEGNIDDLRIGGTSVALERVLAALEIAAGRRLDALPLIRTDRTRVGGELEIERGDGAVTARGTLEIDRLAMAHRRLAREPIDPISGSLALDATFHHRDQRIAIEEAIWRPAAAPEVSYRLTASARRAPRAIAARLEIPRTTCAAMLASIPKALVPELQGFELTGTFAAKLELAIDWRDLDATVLDGSIGIDGCAVRSAPRTMSADRLRGSFEHTVPIGGGATRTYVIGPENPDFVRVDDVSRNLIRSLLTTEDGSFFRHRGIRVKELRAALIKNLERGRFAYGASSITMQMVKNVLLGREKTLSRKLQELFLTWYVESELSKKRILEIYLNAIEFGPGLYGIKPAARQYFGKHPRQLNPVESAFFSSILPAPRRRFRQYCRGHVGGWTRNKMDRIIDRMFDQSRLDPDQYLDAIETPLVFRGKRRQLCR